MRQGKKIPAKTWDDFLRLLSQHTTSVSATCRSLGISPHSYYNYRAHDKRFGELVDVIFDTVRRPYAEDALFALIAEKNLGAIKFYLTHHGGRRWNDTRILPIIVKDEVRNPKTTETEQRLPTVEEEVAGLAYMDILGCEEDKLPDELKIDLRGVKKALENGSISRRRKESL